MPAQEQRADGVYRTIAALPAFWVMLAGILLVNLPFALAHAQIKLLAIDNGLSDAAAALVLSAFAIASIVGRLVSGISIDYLPAHLVAALGFFLPCCGLVLLAYGVDTALAVTSGVAFIGLAFGAEADVIPYLVRHHFPLPVYSTVLGILSAAMGCAIALGNVFIAVALEATARFDPFLVGAALASFVGSGLFLLLSRPGMVSREPVPTAS
jgi:predicted MFS family arabinose efflux permease